MMTETRGGDADKVGEDDKLGRSAWPASWVVGMDRPPVPGLARWLRARAWLAAKSVHAWMHLASFAGVDRRSLPRKSLHADVQTSYEWGGWGVVGRGGGGDERVSCGSRATAFGRRLVQSFRALGTAMCQTTPLSPLVWVSPANSSAQAGA